MKLKALLFFAIAFAPVERVAEGTGAERVATAALHSSVIDELKGTVEMRAVSQGSGAITVDIENAQPGVYSVYLFDTESCAAIPMMYTDPNLANGGGKADGDRVLLLGDAGELTIGEDGRGHITREFSGLKGVLGLDSLHKKAVALFLQRPVSRVSKHLRWASVANGPDACGILRVLRQRNTPA